MTETRPTYVDALREQCTGLSTDDLHSAELMGLYVTRGLEAAHDAGAISARVCFGEITVEAQFYALDDEGMH